MGGANSEVREDTTTVIIEAAYFTGAVVRKASKDHGLRSESSARFEKGVDPERVRACRGTGCTINGRICRWKRS